MPYAGETPCSTRGIGTPRKGQSREAPLEFAGVGTNRIVAVDEDFELPAGANKYLDVTTPDYSSIYGDFEICPLEPDVPGQMRQVRLVRAEKLVVQNLKNPRVRFESFRPGLRQAT
jgi:hypothetical protein